MITDAIADKTILLIEYQHVDDNEIATHRIAPFDIGTTNPKTQTRNADNVYAFSYTHMDKKTNAPDPKVCAFNINHFVRINVTSETFDETDLTRRNLANTRYDYRNCRFAVLPQRDWYT